MPLKSQDCTTEVGYVTGLTSTYELRQLAAQCFQGCPRRSDSSIVCRESASGYYIVTAIKKENELAPTNGDEHHATGEAKDGSMAEDEEIAEEHEAKVRVVVYQTNVTKHEAFRALRNADLDVISAIRLIVMP